MHKAHKKWYIQPAHLIFVIFIFLLPLPLLKENRFVFGSGMFLKRKGQRGNCFLLRARPSGQLQTESFKPFKQVKNPGQHKDTKTQHLKEQQEESFKRKTQTFAFSWQERLRLEKQQVNILVSPFLAETTWGHSHTVLGDKH